MQEDYIPRSETEIRFVSGSSEGKPDGKPDEFEQIRNVGTIQEYGAVREKTFWERIGIGGSITARPIINDGIIYFGAYDKNFYALDLEGKEVWKFPTNGVIQSYALAVGDLVVFGSRDKNLYALDGKTGSLVWKFESEGPIGGSPVEHKGRIYFGSSDGKLYCLDAKGNNIWVFKTPYALITPFIAEDKVFVGYNGSSLYCLNLKGELLWRFNANDWIAAWPAAYGGGKLFFGSGDKNLYAITTSGEFKWKYPAKDVVLSPVIQDGRLYFGCGDKLYCVGSDGERLWDFKTEGSVGHATVSDGMVYFGSYDNYMYAVDKDKGGMKWKFQTNNFVHTNPLVHKDMVIFGSWDCNLYCLDRKSGSLIWKFPTSLGTPSKIMQPEKTETKKIEVVITQGAEKPEEKRYKAHEVMGNYEADVTEYASGMSKTYISSKKKGYID